MFTGRITLFKLMGFEVRVDATWIVLAFLITWSLAVGYFPYQDPGLPHSYYWWMGVAAAVGLFGSIVVHEFAHSVVARRNGLPMEGITLFIFGGVAEMSGEPPNARTEFLMAAAGPLTSILIGAIFYGIYRAAPDSWPPAVVGVIHYLGWPQPIEEIARLCGENGCILIEDCALALLSCLGKRPLGSYGDYSIFCLYKTLPVPNGGMLVQNRHRIYKLMHLPLHPCPARAVAGRCTELALEALRSRFDITGKALFSLKQAIGRKMRSAGMKHVPVGNLAWDINLVNIAMSPVSDHVIRGLEFDHIREKRRSNFEHLRHLIGPQVCMPRRDLPEGLCPLFFPLLVRDKHATAAVLRQKGIEAVEFWSDQQKAVGIGPDALFLRNHVLELPIHQGVSSAQIEFIAEEVQRLNPEPPPC